MVQIAQLDKVCRCNYWLDLPVVHPAIDDGIIHGVGHGEPVDGEVHFLNVFGVGDLRQE
jgi:hypothetical protein